jgi:hypothetical protein
MCGVVCRSDCSPQKKSIHKVLNKTINFYVLSEMDEQEAACSTTTTKVDKGDADYHHLVVLEEV